MLHSCARVVLKLAKRDQSRRKVGGRGFLPVDQPGSASLPFAACLHALLAMRLCTAALLVALACTVWPPAAARTTPAFNLFSNARCEQALRARCSGSGPWGSAGATPSHRRSRCLPRLPACSAFDFLDEPVTWRLHLEADVLPQLRAAGYDVDSPLPRNQVGWRCCCCCCLLPAGQALVAGPESLHPCLTGASRTRGRQCQRFIWQLGSRGAQGDRRKHWPAGRPPAT